MLVPVNTFSMKTPSVYKCGNKVLIQHFSILKFPKGVLFDEKVTGIGPERRKMRRCPTYCRMQKGETDGRTDGWRAGEIFVHVLAPLYTVTIYLILFFRTIAL